ncbi:MAG: ATP-binding protein [Caulobacteraceae bacterium]
MKLRLFWKILLGFWLTFAVLIGGTWLMFASYNQARGPFGQEVIERFSRVQLAAAASALKNGGEPALNQLMASWTAADRALLTVVRPGAAPPPSAPEGVVSRSVTVETLSGNYRLVFQGAWRSFGPTPPRGIPFQVLGLMIACALGFSAVLAWYLTRPIERLRAGFERLARGDLSVRLQGEMGGRRDEIADLVRDFDSMAERLEHFAKVRVRLFHDVSHELRSPLARLLMAIGLARQNPERREASLERIEAESVRLNDLVGELLTLSRVEDRSPHLDGYFDIAGLVRTIAADARFEAESSHVDVRTNVDAEDPDSPRPTVKGNAELLRRGLENVVRNALRFSTAGQTVSIEVATDEAARSFTIEVTDQGPGVPPDALESIFEPFVRAHGVESGQGFGLGLAIARRAVLAHDGAIKAANRPGGGLAVSIRLPFAGG